MVIQYNYVTAGGAPDDATKNNVYSYDTKTNQWTILAQPGHRLGILHMLDERLTIFGGQDPVTYEFLNKVTTYNCDTNSWYSYCPDMLNKRFKPGIITYNNHVIVMGGMSSTDTILDSIEYMNYHRQQLQWSEVSVHLPVPMFTIKPTIAGEYITIVGYSDVLCYTQYYKITAEEVMSSLNQSPSTGAVTTHWKELSAAPYYNTITVPYSNPPVIIGGSDAKGVCKSDISLYDAAKNLWRKVDSLTSARYCVGVGLIGYNTIIIIGGTSGGSDFRAAKASSLTTVEIGNIVPNQQ